ncbi:protein DEK-like isoform X2 [Glandiceps talaboti]
MADIEKKEEKKADSEEAGDAKQASPKKAAKSPQKKKTEGKDEKITKKDEEDAVDDKEEEEEEEEEQRVGLLDKPVEVIKGSRERKKVDRLSLQDNKSADDKKEKFEVKEGRGKKLGEIERIDLQLKKANSDALKPLHRLLFARAGSTFEIKRNIRKFSGFPFTKEDSNYEKKENNLIKYTVSGLKEFCEWLDLEKGGTKEDIIHRILDFLLEPAPSGKPMPKPKRKRGEKRKKRTPKDKKEKKNKTTDKTEKKKKTKKKKDEDEKKSDEIISESESESESEEEEEEEEEIKKKRQKVEEKSPKKTPKKTPQKSSTPKKKAKVSSTPKKEKKQQKKETPKKERKRKVSVSSDSSDDEPLVKKVKSPPTDDQIRDIIKKILDGANLEEITMKTVCKQVYAKFPDFDLSDRKDFIKSTVRQIIS